MIYYFSGTGNSKHVAEKLSVLLGEELRSMGEACVDACDVLGLVFPVYAWGLPSVVEEFVRNIKGIKPAYVWAVMTCGDDMGYTDKILSSELKRMGLKLDSVYSVSMPNTYVCLPGFDVDADDVATKKVASTDERIPIIVVNINERKNVVDVVRGPMPFLKSYILRPLFNNTLVTDRFFHTNSNCNSCGLCARNCPLYNITMDSGKVVWKGNCTGCLRCYHQCPNKAIQFGCFTKSKGQKKAL